MLPTRVSGATDAPPYRLSAGQRGHRHAVAATWRCRGFHNEGHVHGTAHRRQGGPGRGKVPCRTQDHGPYRHSVPHGAVLS